MDDPLHSLRRHVEELHAAWAGPCRRCDSGGDAQAEVEQMSDAGLVRVGDCSRGCGATPKPCSPGSPPRCHDDPGPSSATSASRRRRASTTRSRLIAASTGGSRHDAARLIAVGRATAQRQAFGGERLPSRHPHVAAALREGDIALEAASAITSMLDRVAISAEPARADAVEAALVELAAQVPLELLMRGVREAEARLDEDGVEPREQDLRQERSLTMREDVHGMVHLHARLDPENAAPVKAAIEALVSDVLRRREPAALVSAPSPTTCARFRRSRPTRSQRSPATRWAARRRSRRSRRPRWWCASISKRSAAESVTRASTASTSRSPPPPPAAWPPTPNSSPPCSAVRASRSTSGGPLGCSAERNASPSASATAAAPRAARTSPTSRPTTSPGGSATPVRPTSRTGCSSAVSATTWCTEKGGGSARRRFGVVHPAPARRSPPDAAPRRPRAIRIGGGAECVGRVRPDGVPRRGSATCLGSGSAGVRAEAARPAGAVCGSRQLGPRAGSSRLGWNDADHGACRRGGWFALRARRSRGVRATLARRNGGTEASVTVIVNTGDDLWLAGVRLMPDFDSLLYSLAGVNDTERGLGSRGRDRTGGRRAARVGRRMAVVHARRPRPRHTPRAHRLAARGRDAVAGGDAAPGALAARRATHPGDRHRGRHACARRRRRRARRRARAALPGVVDALPRGVARHRIPPTEYRSGGARALGRRGDRRRPISCSSRRRTRSSRSARSCRCPASARRSARRTRRWWASRRSSAAGSCAAWPTPACPRSASTRRPRRSGGTTARARRDGLIDGWLVDETDAAAVAPLEDAGLLVASVPLWMRDLDTSAALAGEAIDLGERIARQA